ncbi:MAG: protein kinase [Blastocatellia bacterium]|nr:protein kinase [Blastocatellia bacterium]
MPSLRYVAWSGLALFWVVLFSVLAGAQPTQLRFRHLTIEQGLSQNSAQCLLQDRSGFLWVGTQDGLNRFDGYSFKIYRNQPNNPASLGGNWIQTMLEDPSGKIWLGTNGGGVSCYNPRTDRFETFKNNPQDPTSLCGNDVRHVCLGPDGKLWVATRDGGIGTIDLQTRACASLQEPLTQAGLTVKAIRRLLFDRSGRLWIGTIENGLYRYEPHTRKLTGFRNNPAWKAAFTGQEVMALFEDETGFLWVGTMGGGLVRLRLKDESVTVFRHDPQQPDSLGSNDVLSIFERRDGSLWIGTRGGGLNRYRPETEDFQVSKSDLTLPEALHSNDIWSLCEDTSGIFWVGTDSAGLSYHDRQNERFTTYRNNPFKADSLAANNVRAMWEDASGVVWIGTNGGGLNRFNPATDGFTAFRTNPQNPASLPVDAVFALCETKAGDFWVGTRGGGLARLDRAKGTFVTFQKDPQKADSLSENTIWALLEDHTGTLWVGTNGGGLCRFDPARQAFAVYKHDPKNPGSLGSNDIFTLYEDPQGILWVGTRGGGLARFDRERDTFTVFKNDPNNPRSLSNNAVRSVCRDRSGTLWVGTNGGLNRFDPATQSFEVFREAQGLPNDTIYGILEDAAGNLWMSTNRGISRFTPAHRRFRNFDVTDGLQSNEFNWNAWGKLRDGRMVFGGVGGFTLFDPAAIQDLPFVPPVVLTGFRIFNQDVALPEAVSFTPEITITHNDAMVTFEFAALSYAQAERNRYAYKLEGFDRDWIQAGTKHEATYTNLDGGHYVFRVKASNCDGIWNQTGVQVRVVVVPPPWKRWWAYCLYVVLLGGGLWGGFRVQTQRLKERARLQEARLQAETAQAQALAAEIQAQAVEAENRQRAEAEAAIKKKNEELAEALERARRLQAETERQNRELVASQQQADRIFSALAEALPGTVLDGKYQLEEKIGTGGFGAVFRAQHLALSIPVAVKVFRPTPGNDSADAVERFRLEGISAARIKHPNAISVLDSGISTEGIAYLVMELLQGHSLNEELHERRQLSLRRTVTIIEAVCQALAEAHRLGIIHRDIKPANIFLNQGPEGEVVKVVDFGIAKFLGEDTPSQRNLTATGGIIGTPTYMSPERLKSEPYDGRADVYSVAVMTFEMLAGRTPFVAQEGDFISIILAHLNQLPPEIRTLAPEVPAQVEAVITLALAKNPEARPGAKEFAETLMQAAQPFFAPDLEPPFSKATEPFDTSELPTGVISPATSKKIPAVPTEVDLEQAVTKAIKVIVPKPDEK